MKRAMVAMSGGVDSSVAALLALEAGFDAYGASALMHGEGGFDDARAVCDRLGIEHFIFDLRDCFKKCVTDKFARSYMSGATPNPCVDCNRYIKFSALLDCAGESDMLVTGHYARVEKDSSRYLLKKALDASKDQSYVLYTLGQKTLARVMLPLGEISKDEARKIAARRELINADRPDSQDICFVPDGDYAGFIERYTHTTGTAGDFVDMCGNTLGRHSGIIHYTIGQRRGMGLALAYPGYVVKKDAAENTVVVGKNSDLYSSRLVAHDINLIALDSIDSKLSVCARTRYNQREQPAIVTQTAPDEIVVEFASPQRAITTGQSVVLYDGDIVIGGGIID